MRPVHSALPPLFHNIESLRGPDRRDILHPGLPSRVPVIFQCQHRLSPVGNFIGGRVCRRTLPCRILAFGGAILSGSVGSITVRSCLFESNSVSAQAAAGGLCPTCRLFPCLSSSGPQLFFQSSKSVHRLHRRGVLGVCESHFQSSIREHG